MIKTHPSYTANKDPSLGSRSLRDTRDPVYVRLWNPGEHGLMLLQTSCQTGRMKNHTQREECQTAVLGGRQKTHRAPPPLPCSAV